ncbi:uncharacterized protein [Pyxicephalus adspersus]|uniref:uncharacterized protein n=1 Tax=Pyxicephalus adspersus TaxID=30357 RepID=UPI003B5B33A4
MVLTPKDILLTALQKLNEKSFAQFKTKLSTWDVKKNYERIPSSRLEGADPPSVADLIVEFYNYNYGITVSLAVLDAINEKKIREGLLEDLEEGWSSEDFFDSHRSDLISLNIRLDPILYYLHYLKLLTDEQYKDLTEQPIYERKMEGLLDTIRCWDETSKRKVHQALECYSPEEIEKLNTAHILQNTIEVEGRKFLGFGVFPPNTRRFLEGSTKGVAGNNILDIYEENLIDSIIMVDPVLDDLHDQQLLTQRQHRSLLGKKTPREKMRSLCDTVRTWSDSKKEKVYKALRKYNYKAMRNLVTHEDTHYLQFQPIFRNHFLDRNQKELIDKIGNIDPVLHDLLDQHLLTEQQYTKIKEKPSSQEKMKWLCDTIHNWSYPNKDKVYDVLRRHNYEELRALEKTYVPYRTYIYGSCQWKFMSAGRITKKGKSFNRKYCSNLKSFESPEQNMIKKQIISIHLRNLDKEGMEKFKKNLCQMKPPRGGGSIKMADLKDKSMKEMVEFIFKCHGEKHGVSTVEKVLKAISDNQTRVAMMRDLRKVYETPSMAAQSGLMQSNLKSFESPKQNMIKKQIISTHLKNLGKKSLEKFRKNLCQMKPPRSGGPIKMADLKDKSIEKMVAFIFKCHSEKHGVSTVEKVLKAINDNQTRVAMMRDLRKASKSTKDVKIEQNKGK